MNGAAMRYDDEPPQFHTVHLTSGSNGMKVAPDPSIPRASTKQLQDALLPGVHQASLASAANSLGQGVELPSDLCVQLSSTVIPSTPTALDKFGLPIGFHVRPLADTKLPIVNFADLGDCGVIRCKRCRAYVCPFSTFIDSNRRWICSLCKAANDTHPRYLAALSSARPELTNCSVEFIAPADYMVRPPQRPIYLFLLDVSHAAVSSGLLEECCQGMLLAIDALVSKKEETINAGIVCYDANVYLFGMKSTQSSPRMIVCSDYANDIVRVNEETGLLDTVELPALLDELVVPLVESQHLFRQVAELLPTLFKGSRSVESGLGPALNVAMTMLNPTGGKLICSIAGCPSLGEGRIVSRGLSSEAFSKIAGTQAETSFIVPSTEWYKTRALACSQAQISVDLIANGNVDVATQPIPIDLASVVPLSKFTGGHIYRLTPYNAGALRTSICDILTRTIAFESVLRVRVASPLVVTNFFGHCYVRAADLLALPICDEDSVFSVQLNLAGPATNAAPQSMAGSVSTFIGVQVALLYTTRTRERRIRVHNFAFEAHRSMNKVFNASNALASAALMMKLSIDQVATRTFATCQSQLMDRLVTCLKTFRLTCLVGPGGPVAGKPSASNGLLHLPTTIRHLPMFLHAFSRLSACRSTAQVWTNPDDRVAVMAMITSSPIFPDVASLLSPSIQMLSCPRYRLDQTPAPLDANAASYLRHDGIYLLNTGLHCVLWHGKSAIPEHLVALGLGDADTQSATDFKAQPEFEPHIERCLDCIAEQEQRSRRACCIQRVAIAQPKPPGGSAASPSTATGLDREVTATLLTDDEVKDLQSYGSFLVALQRRVAQDS